VKREEEKQESVKELRQTEIKKRKSQCPADLLWSKRCLQGRRGAQRRVKREEEKQESVKDRNYAKLKKRKGKASTKQISFGPRDAFGEEKRSTEESE
jgi:hypothetical protein